VAAACQASGEVKIMATGGTNTIGELWLTFLVETEFAKNYQRYDMAALSLARNPILESLLPSLLYLRLVSLLDESLASYMAANKLPKRGTLGGKIELLNTKGLLANSAKLCSVKKMRNGLAHDATKSCAWAHLDTAINDVEAELQHLGLIGPRPVLEFYAVQEAARDSSDPAFSISQDYRCGVKKDGNKFHEYVWTLNM
jgi:hypothetical protein